MREPSFWLISVGHALSLLTVSSMPAHLIPHLVRGMNYSLIEAGYAFALMTGYKWLADSWRNPRPIQQKIHLRPMYGGTLCGPVLRDLRNQRDMGNRVRCFHGLAWGIRGPLMVALRADYFGPKSFGTIMGVSSSCNDRNDNRTYRLWPSFRSVRKLSTCFHDNGALLAQWESMFLVRKTTRKRAPL